MNPGKIVRADADGRRVAVPLSAGLSQAADDDGARLVGVERAATIRRPRRGQRARHRRRSGARASRKAVEMCNNNGHCRKFDAGTMCPSFRVTRDEEHLTRGRANTLRLALSGQLGDDFAVRAVREALDLCVSCKGCRRDCPTGVDMAKMKIEFLHHWQQAHRLARQGPADREACRAGRRGPRACRGSPTCAIACPGSRALTERWSASPRSARCRAGGATRSCRATPSDDDPKPNVVLFVDTFTNYFEPENAHAALAVLRAAGYRVAVARASPATRSRRDRCAADARSSPPGASTKRGAKRSACSRRSRRMSRRARRSSGSSRRACCRCATNSW